MLGSDQILVYFWFHKFCFWKVSFTKSPTCRYSIILWNSAFETVNFQSKCLISGFVSCQNCCAKNWSVSTSTLVSGKSGTSLKFLVSRQAVSANTLLFWQKHIPKPFVIIFNNSDFYFKLFRCIMMGFSTEIFSGLSAFFNYIYFYSQFHFHSTLLIFH